MTPLTALMNASCHMQGLPSISMLHNLTSCSSDAGTKPKHLEDAHYDERIAPTPRRNLL
jgi:hypothetical protein